MKNSYNDIEDLLQTENPGFPVYCIYPFVYRRSTQHFIDGFPGRVLYAIKANDHPIVLNLMHDSGVTHYDCASLPEIQLVHEHCPDSTCYLMNPVRIPGHAAIAQQKYGVRHFVIDDRGGLGPLVEEIDPSGSVIFARMAVSHESAMVDLSYKFGARPEDIPELLAAIAETGAEPALAFNVGSGVTDPQAYAHAMAVAHEVLDGLPFAIRLLDVGGGYPTSYPDFLVPEIGEFFDRIDQGRKSISLATGGELLSEPGRALSAPGMSALTCVLLRKSDCVYLNDGIYGAFAELRFKAHMQYPLRAYRDGKPLSGKTRPFSLFGPTCDSTDEFPAKMILPEDIAVGDHIEFGTIGAYSLSSRTNFNGFYSDKVISFSDEKALPPVMKDTSLQSN